MLNGKVIFDFNSEVYSQDIDNIVKGDHQSVKLIIQLLDSVGNYQDLSGYVVNMIIERPDGSKTPELSLSLNYEDTTQRTILIDKEITAIAGECHATVKFRQDGIIKNTGLFNFEVEDSVIPTDPLINEAQLHALQDSINANDQAISSHVQNKDNPHETNGDNALLGVGEAETIHQAITRVEGIANQGVDDASQVASDLAQEVIDRKAEDTLIRSDISELSGEITANTNDISNHKINISNPHRTHGENANINATSDKTIKAYIDEQDLLRLKKDFSDITIANNVAQDDYFIINSNGTSYKVTTQFLKENIFQGGGGEVVNHYKGDYLTKEALQQAHPQGVAGDYVFVNTDEEMVMYVWDTDDNTWKETTSGQYVTTVTFNTYKQNITNGTSVVGKAKDFDETGGTIKEELDKKLAKTTQSAVAYVTDAQGRQSELQYNKEAIGGGLAQRNNDGTLNVADAINDTNAVNKKQLNDETSATKLATKLEGDDTIVVDLMEGNNKVEIHLDEIFKNSLAKKSDLNAYMPKYNYKGDIWENEFYQYCLNTPNVDNGAIFSVELLNDTPSDALTRGFPQFESGAIMYGYFYLGQTDSPIILLTEKGVLKVINGSSNLTCESLSLTSSQKASLNDIPSLTQNVEDLVGITNSLETNKQNKLNAGANISIDQSTNTISATGGSQYTLPTASSSVKGGVKVGSGLTMSGDTMIATAKGTKVETWTFELEDGTQVTKEVVLK